MTLDAPTLEKLMAFADGELEGDEKKSVELLITTNEEAARIVDEMLVLGQCLRVVEEARATALPDLSAGIMERVEKERAAGGQVIDLAARRRRVTTTVVALVAAAAGVFFFARPAAQPDPATAVRSTPPAATSAPSVAPPTTVAASTPPVPAPAPSDDVSVIVVPGAGEVAPSVVIWLGDDKAGGGTK